MAALGTLVAGDSSAALLHIAWLPVAHIGEALLWAAALLTLLTGWDYLTAGLKHVGGPAAARPPRAVPGTGARPG
jgi:cardiolipin synthase